MRLELGQVDHVDGRPRLADFANFRWRHFADPEDVMPLQSGVDEVDGAVTLPPKWISKSVTRLDK